MSKILIVKFPFTSRFGGGEKHTMDIVDAVLPLGYRVSLLGSCRVLTQEFRRRRLPVSRLWVSIEPVTPLAVAAFLITALPAFIVLSALLVVYRIRGVKILYCLSLTEKVLVAWVARLLGMRVFFMEHRLLEHWLTRNPLRPLYALNARCAKVIAVSQALADQLVRVGVPHDRVAVISPGVELDQFSWPRKREDHHGAFIIGTVAGLEPGKGIAYLLQALREVKADIGTVRGLIVGTGPERASLQWLAQQLGLKEHVQWVGFQREAFRWYGHFDVFVLPSVKPESFGIVVTEAMAAGVPVVATKIGAVPEIISDGVNGYLVPAGDAHTLAEKLLWLYYHRAEVPRITQAARALVEERYRRDAMIRKFIRLFDHP